MSSSHKLRNNYLVSNPCESVDFVEPAGSVGFAGPTGFEEFAGSVGL